MPAAKSTIEIWCESCDGPCEVPHWHDPSYWVAAPLPVHHHVTGSGGSTLYEGTIEECIAQFRRDFPDDDIRKIERS